MTGTAMKNWGGNISFEGSTVHAPSSLDHLQELVAASRSCRALGSRHSFNQIAVADTILDTSQLPTTFSLADDRRSVRVSGYSTYAEVAHQLSQHELALRNLASLPHISVAGAIATGSHGSGDQNQNLAASVSGLSVLGANGEFAELDRDDSEFRGAVVSLGALGIVTEVELEVIPTFDVEQRVYDGPTLTELAEGIDDVMASGYSVSVFTHWAGQADQIWVKQRVGDAVGASSASFLSELTEAKERQHPVRTIEAVGCTEQLGIPGPWFERLPHFQMGFTPSAGDEIQSEFFVDRRFASEAIEAMRSIGNTISEALMVGEIRSIAADSLWMSPHTGRDSLAFHFTWHPAQKPAREAANAVMDALAPFEVRTHWGKLFDPDRVDLGQFTQRSDFLDLVERFDPSGKFRNRWFDEVIAR